ncbi:hypothetical protein MUK70_21180 [Dyadobacter chenwenxiniae]|uniref:Uncharacterized protein n=1 Tax=Dyadobacter chenwenxiniae TaxID=2906456 RepID=A0A9X1PI76_9BACT|nr:plasmid partition family protein [Dyadobacter chenwenxiniae]MCF0061757.1 hypothetical protein [Dyadobacter chenwenxiniae]UON81574.1 hypothetical protein MUK70_21180 [Dyadobacter chenwenxiniae]
MEDAATDYKLLYEQAIAAHKKSLELISEKDKQIQALNFELDKYKRYIFGKKNEKLARYLVDKTIKFEKLFYHASRAWNGPTVAMQVDSSKSMYMRYTNNTGSLERGLPTGRYKAVLDDDTYNELIKQLQNCNLRTLRFGNIKGNDAPDITLIVYFNGKRKYLKSMFPPRISEELLTFIMLRLQGYGKLIPTDENKDLEWRP